MNDLLDKYFSGTATDSEKLTLFQEIEKNKELKDEFVLLQNIITLSVMEKRESDSEYVEQKYKELGNHIAKRKRTQLYITFSKYAAVILLISATWFTTMLMTQNERTENFTFIEVPKGQQIHVVLADKSEVWLSSRSKLKISNTFNELSRTIELDGEAFFSVSQNKEMPFIVKTNKYNVEVTGTQFNVLDYSGSPLFETELVEGGVRIYKGNRENNVALMPNEKVILNDGKLFKKPSAFVDSYAIKNGIYMFENKTIREISDRLELWYDVEISIPNDTIANGVIRGKFRQTDDIGNILKAIKETGKFDYSVTNEREVKLF